MALSGVLTVDDSREAVLTQTLAWGYQPRQPPFYNWLVWGAVQLLGVGVLALTVVKYAVLVTAYALVHAAARRTLADPRLAVLAALALVLMVPIGWVVHESLTHSIAVLAAAAGTVHALLRLEATGSRRAYAALGLALGVGFLSKFSFALFAGALLCAALTVAPYRRRLLHPRVVWTLAAVVLCLLPFALWFYRHDFSLGRIYRQEVDPGEPDAWLPGVLSAFYYIARVTAYYLTPLWIVLLALFPDGWRGKAPGAAAVPAHRLLERFFLAELAILVAGALVGGVTYLKFRWLFAGYFLFPLYFFSRLDPAAIDPARVRRFAGLLLAVGCLALVAFPVNLLRGDRLGRASHLATPYDRIARQLAAAGFTRGTIAAGEGPVAGNLRLAFPDARVVRQPNPDYLPPRRAADGQCLIVWETERVADEVPAEMRAWLAAALDVRLPAALAVRTAEARFHFARRQTLQIHYVLLPDGAGECR